MRAVILGNLPTSTRPPQRRENLYLCHVEAGLSRVADEADATACWTRDVALPNQVFPQAGSGSLELSEPSAMPSSRSCRSSCRLSLVRADAPDMRTVGRGCALDVAQEPKSDITNSGASGSSRAAPQILLRKLARAASARS
jgi:hypothetical protein